MRDIPATDLGTSTETIISEGSTSKQLINIITGTQPITVATRTFSPSEASRLVAVSVMPMLSLVHHQSDLPSAISSQTASPSSSATRVAPNGIIWGGLGSFLATYLVVVFVYL